MLTPADFGVEKILAHRTVRGQVQYLVQWEGCSYLQSTYEPESNLIHAQSKLAEYQQKRRQIETDVACVLCEDPFRSGEVVHADIPKPQQCPVDPPRMRTRQAVDYRRVNALLKPNVDEFNHSD